MFFLDLSFHATNRELACGSCASLGRARAARHPPTSIAATGRSRCTLCTLCCVNGFLSAARWLLRAREGRRAACCAIMFCRRECTALAVSCSSSSQWETLCLIWPSAGD